MLAEFKKINSEGFITDSCILDINSIIPSDMKKSWDEKHSFYIPRWDKKKNEWIETVKMPDALEVLKNSKKKYLSKECEEKILKGFYMDFKGEKTHFSYDEKDQLNFQDSYNLFQNNLLEKIGWTVTVGEVKERIKLSKQEFLSVYVEAIRHKNGCLDYLHETLLKKLTLAKTIKEVEAILWEKPKSEIILDTSNMLDKKVKSIDEVAKDSTAQKAYNGYTESMLMEVIDIALMGVSG